MNPERWEEVLRLFEAASRLEAAEREAYLARECPDAELVAEVRKLLGAPTSGGFLEPPRLDEPGQGRDLGDFTLFEEIGRGGMGVVYRALQRPLGRIVAVKVLPASFALTPRQVERFTREARAAAKLSHPNLVTVLTVGEERGVRYFAMEYVDGKNLAEELARLRADLGAEEDQRAHLPSSRASDYFRSIAESVRQAADGLAFAHESGIVHRDVKPSNLLLDPAGRVKLVDFGLARDEELGSLSGSGEVVGTPHYMSPEQARAQRHKVDHRTDVYSLGVVLYELLTLRRPFEGNTAQEVLDNVIQREPARIRRLNPRVPRDLETICQKAMAKEPRHRYVDAGALRDDLQHFLEHEAIVAKPPGAAQLLAQRVRCHGKLLALGASVVLAVLGGIWVQGVRRERMEREEDLAILHAALRQAPLRQMPLPRLLDLRRRYEGLSRGSLRAESGEDDVARFGKALADLRQELKSLGEADIRAARDETLPEGTREFRRLVGLQKLFVGAQLFPEDEELQRLSALDSTYPTLTVRAYDESNAEVMAEVGLRSIDLLTSEVGPRQALGTTPLVSVPTLPGYYRVVVQFPSGGFRELICNLGPASMEVVLSARRRPDETAIGEGMIGIPGGPYSFPELDGEARPQGSVELQGFLIDPCEVSNLDFARFTASTGAPSPALWRFVSDQGAFLRDHGELPVVGLTWSQAVAYSEWAGKRLPTLAEWHRVAGGPDNWPTPYSADRASPPRGNIEAPLLIHPTLEENWGEYLLRARPVRSDEGARSPEGAYHCFGNVAELTESMAFVLGPDSLPVPRVYDRFYSGEAWHALASGGSMRSVGYWGLGPSYTIESIGFRCAKSQQP